MEYRIICISIFLIIIQVVKAQPIVAGSTELIIKFNENSLVFDSIQIKDSCSSFSQCIYLVKSKKNNFSVEITTSSFSKNIKPIQLNDGNIVVNTGIKLNPPFSISGISIFDNNKNQMYIKTLGGNNLNNYNIEIQFFRGDYNLLLQSLAIDKKIYIDGFFQDLHNIYVSAVKNGENKSLEFYYELLNPKDSIFLKFRRSGDFGKIYSESFSLKKNIPDGEYKIYVENKLSQKSYIKNGLKDGLWIEYKENGERRETPYHKDTVNGNIVEYYPNNIVKRRTIIDKGNLISRETYSKFGIIQMKEHFKKNRAFKIDKYNEKGKLKEEKIIDVKCN